MRSFITKRPIAPLAVVVVASLVVSSFSSERVRWDLLSLIALAMSLLATCGAVVVAARVLIRHRAEEPVLFWFAAVGGATLTAITVYGLFQEQSSADIGAGMVALVGLVLLAVGAFASTTSRENGPVRSLDTKGGPVRP